MRTIRVVLNCGRRVSPGCRTPRLVGAEWREPWSPGRCGRRPGGTAAAASERCGMRCAPRRRAGRAQLRPAPASTVVMATTPVGTTGPGGGRCARRHSGARLGGRSRRSSARRSGTSSTAGVAMRPGIASPDSDNSRPVQHAGCGTSCPSRDLGVLPRGSRRRVATPPVRCISRNAPRLSVFVLRKAPRVDRRHRAGGSPHWGHRRSLADSRRRGTLDAGGERPRRSPSVRGGRSCGTPGDHRAPVRRGPSSDWPGRAGWRGPRPAGVSASGAQAVPVLIAAAMRS